MISRNGKTSHVADHTVRIRESSSCMADNILLLLTVLSERL